MRLAQSEDPYKSHENYNSYSKDRRPAGDKCEPLRRSDLCLIPARGYVLEAPQP